MAAPGVTNFIHILIQTNLLHNIAKKEFLPQLEEFARKGPRRFLNPCQRRAGAGLTEENVRQ